MVGLLVGAVDILYLNRRFAARSLSEKLVGKTVFYAVLLTGVILVTFPIATAMEVDAPLTDPRVWERLQDFLVSKTSLGTGVQLTTSLVASLFYAEISEHMGHQVLAKFLTGRYHTPKAECRVFLFSDMKSFTRIAEEIGHARYFELLSAYYDSLADAIVDHGGEVYQYIVDESVVSWPEEVGLRNNGCIRCILRMKSDLRARGQWFERRFGVVPDFKAGIQLGSVTTGEIGALKKEIVFSGDVLNQTARIQGLCGEMASEVLVGDERTPHRRRRVDLPVLGATRLTRKGTASGAVRTGRPRRSIVPRSLPVCVGPPLTARCPVVVGPAARTRRKGTPLK